MCCTTHVRSTIRKQTPYGSLVLARPLERIAIARSSTPLLRELAPPRTARRRTRRRPLLQSVGAMRTAPVAGFLLRRQLDVPRPRQGRGRRDRQCRGNSLVGDACKTELTRLHVELG